MKTPSKHKLQDLLRERILILDGATGTMIQDPLSDYGVEFASAVCRNNIYGLQFHPEKSQELGLKMLKNFGELK